MRPTSASRACAVFLLVAAVFSGCGGGGAAGTYSHEQEGMKMTLQLKGGGKAVMSLTGPNNQQPLPSVEGTYTVEGDKVTVIMDGDTDVYTLKDGTLSTGQNDFFGEQLVLKKQ